jgi:hypothetical protein
LESGSSCSRPKWVVRMRVTAARQAVRTYTALGLIWKSKWLPPVRVLKPGFVREV